MNDGKVKKVNVIKGDIVHERDDGIRPAGKSDACFYCRKQVGTPHAKDCVSLTRKVTVKYEFTIELDVPSHWTVDDIEFDKNEGSWCAENAIDEIKEYVEVSGLPCGCSIFKGIVVAHDPTSPTFIGVRDE